MGLLLQFFTALDGLTWLSQCRGAIRAAALEGLIRAMETNDCSEELDKYRETLTTNLLMLLRKDMADALLVTRCLGMVGGTFRLVRVRMFLRFLRGTIFSLSFCST